MFRALKLRHVPTVMVRVPDESHELSRSGRPWHRVDRLRHIANWFDKWLQGKVVPGVRRAVRSWPPQGWRVNVSCALPPEPR